MSTDSHSTDPTPGAGRWIRGPREFVGGLALMALALFALWAARDLPVEESLSAGSFPRGYAWLLLALSAGVTLAGILVRSASGPRYAWRGPVLVVASIIVFALTIRPFGLALASFTAFMLGSLASEQTRWVESLVAAVILTAFCALLFVYGLGIPVKIFP